MVQYEIYKNKYCVSSVSWTIIGNFVKTMGQPLMTFGHHAPHHASALKGRFHFTHGSFTPSFTVPSKKTCGSWTYLNPPIFTMQNRSVCVTNQRVLLEFFIPSSRDAAKRSRGSSGSIWDRWLDRNLIRWERLLWNNLEVVVSFHQKQTRNLLLIGFIGNIYRK